MERPRIRKSKGNALGLGLGPEIPQNRPPPPSNRRLINLQVRENARLTSGTSMEKKVISPPPLPPLFLKTPDFDD